MGEPSSTTAIDIGFIGLGTIAHNHASRTQTLGESVAYGLDISEEARASFAEAFGAQTITAMDDLLARDPDLVVITTPNCFHEKYATAALTADINVLCEKPLAHTKESAERIVRAAESSDAFLLVGFNNRFSGVTEVTKGAIEKGRLGEITHVDANFIRRRGIPGQDDRGRGSWFTSEAMAGGGALVDIGVHALDLALSLTGFPPVHSVSGQTRAQLEAGDVEDAATGLIRCVDGTTIDLDAAWVGHRPPNRTVIIEGTDAGAQFTLGGSEVTFYEVDGDASDTLQTNTVAVEAASSHCRELAYCFECIHTNTQPERNTPHEALVVQRVIDALYQSAREDRALAAQTGSAPREAESPIVNN